MISYESDIRKRERGSIVEREVAEFVAGQGPIAATAIHNGHEIREEVEALMALAAADRLREEDPYTGILTPEVTTSLVVSRSRFEVDLNRPRENAIYRSPEDAWGLDIWKGELPADVAERSLAQYDEFYAKAHDIFSEMERRFGHFVVLDIHSYNHRRGGPDAPPEDAALNPEVNVGTGTLDRDRWGGLVDRFMTDLNTHETLGRHLDVRENVKFKGGHLSAWIHENFPRSACCLAVEFKKFFMDEWTGRLDSEEFEAIAQALQATLPGLLESLEGMDKPADD